MFLAMMRNAGLQIIFFRFLFFFFACSIILTTKRKYGGTLQLVLSMRLVSLNSLHWAVYICAYVYIYIYVCVCICKMQLVLSMGLVSLN